MTATPVRGRAATDPAPDPIGLEILRARLAAVADEGAITIERTAISPAMTESRDYSCTLLDANGDLIGGAGGVHYHFGVCAHAVRTTTAVHGDSIAPGDMFFANDPHRGGGLHAQDVLVQAPVFDGDRLVAWVVASGHMADIGGLVFGSWSTAATDCYQEGLRLPPVRIFRRGVEQQDIWQIFRSNVRVPDIVEMDLRGLVAACHVGREKMLAIAASVGVEEFLAGVATLQERSETETRRRISALADGVYAFTTWTEWGHELYRVPCRLTVEGDAMVFDFTGAPPQTTHFFNSKPHIITAEVVVDVMAALTFDLPLSQGMFAPVTIVCPPGSILDSTPPAPLASAHVDVAANAAMAAQQCVMMAVAASGPVEASHLLCGPQAVSTIAMQMWSFTTPAGRPDGWMMLDGVLNGGSAGADRDGYDFYGTMVATAPALDAIDVEMLELWYPVLTLEKRRRPGGHGAGRHRAGSCCQMRYTPYGTARLQGAMLAVRENLPLPGVAGGAPGALTEFRIRGADGVTRLVEGKRPDVVLHENEEFEFRLAGGSGFGDPLDREPSRVARDHRQRLLTVEEAADAYGVVLVDGVADEDATAALRATRRADRLAAARPPHVIVDASVPAEVVGLTLYPGVEQRGDLAVAVGSGTPLAVSPGDWQDGCAVLTRPLGEAMVLESYIDPGSGRVLMAEVKPVGEPRTVDARPTRWIDAAGGDR